MASALTNILVVGGNGFIGSAVCRAALAKGMSVTSVSSSGRPWTTPKGHSPAWTSQVNWRRGDAFNPESFASELEKADGVVHTLGTLLEDGAYKQAIRDGDIFGVTRSLMGGASNPLKASGGGLYDKLNRDAALRVCEAYTNTASPVEGVSKPFVYISAEDIFRPIVPARYIESKREAEAGIEALVTARSGFRGVYIRPSLVYHAHFRPLTTPLAVLLEFSSKMQAKLPSSVPSPSSILRRFGMQSVPNALEIPPVHVDHVGEAVCVALERGDVRGVVGVDGMRELIGWRQSSAGDGQFAGMH
ncbi:NAD(P)-binding protein [Cylindrobasidium torrendii FP15055 ss-10]|uniref:NAD(P)-binding protein n=1 Tax=Cylindrobasidium torrendii FP15055 ss-10 TaxID=1314674 RepID=A0A0D7BNS8_9AGAR|nr:NAD(P)-binding protein [Cylindrobasidium torrendii FP15055 ss-10]